LFSMRCVQLAEIHLQQFALVQQLLIGCHFGLCDEMRCDEIEKGDKKNKLCANVLDILNSHSMCDTLFNHMYIMCAWIYMHIYMYTLSMQVQRPTELLASLLLGLVSGSALLEQRANLDI
jgi:hypothetical protein